MENKNLLEIQKLNALFSQKESRLSEKLLSLVGSLESQKTAFNTVQAELTTKKEREQELENQVEHISIELKTQTNLAEKRLLALVQREKVLEEKHNIDLKNSDLTHLLNAAQQLESQLCNELANHQQMLIDVVTELENLKRSFTYRLTAPLRGIYEIFIPSKATMGIRKVPLSSFENVTPSLLQPIQEIPMPSITPIVAVSSLDELLAYHDADFVHCAYITLLGRIPDPEGMRYYLGRLRAGRAKIAIIDQLVLSSEGKSKNSKILGLDQAIKAYRIRKIPFFGSIFSLLYGYSSQSIIEEKLLIIENQIYRNNKDYLKKIDWLEKNLISLRKDIKITLNTASAIQPKPDLVNQGNAGEIYIDITTLMKWNRPPVGIIRVLLEVVKFSLSSSSNQYFCFNSSKDDMKIIDFVIVKELVERLSNLNNNSNHAENDQYFAKIRMLLDFANQTEVGADDFLPFHNGQLSPLFGAEVLIAKNKNSFFESQDTVISIGLDWDSSNYSILHWLKKRIGFKFVGAFYDGIPVVAPHLVQSYGFSQMFFQHIYNLIHLSDKIFSISYFSENQLGSIIDKHQIERTPDIKTIYLGDSEDNMTMIENNHLFKSRAHAKNYAIYVSTIETRKNHKLLLEVWRRMIDLNIPNIPDLVCVGMWGWGIEELRERYFSDKDLQKYIHFYDDVDDAELGYLYQGAMFSLFPSFMEGWGLGAVESMTYGIPSVISTTPALIEATQNLMPTADPENPEEWIIQIRRILNDTRYFDSLRESIKENFERKTWATFSREFYSFALENK